MFVGVLVGVGVAVSVGVLVGVDVAVSVGVLVGVDVAVSVGVFVGVLVGVDVAVSVGVLVGVDVAVSVGVLVGVFVGVAVAVSVDVFVGVDSTCATVAREPWSRRNARSDVTSRLRLACFMCVHNEHLSRQNQKVVQRLASIGREYSRLTPVYPLCQRTHQSPYAMVAHTHLEQPSTAHDRTRRLRRRGTHRAAWHARQDH